MKYILGVLIILLISTNVFWALSVLDKAITADHTSSNCVQVNKSLQTSLAINNIFLSEQDYKHVSDRLELAPGSNLIKHRRHAIFVDSVVLIFDNNKLSEVKLLNELSSVEYESLEK